MRNELARSIDFAGRQDELYSLLERQVRLYTMGDSSSLPVETAQELLRSIQFLIQIGLSSADTGGQRAALSHLFVQGGRDVWRLTEDAKTRYAMAKQTGPGYGSVAYRDTLDAIGKFFSAYDLRFFAHDIPCMIDYPLARPVSEDLEGVLFIDEYLRRLVLENRFCRCFGLREATEALFHFHPEYKELVLNLFEPVFTCAAGLALLGKNPESLRLRAEDCARLYGQFHPWEEVSAREKMRGAVNLVCIHFHLWDTAMRDYLLESAEHLLLLLKNTSREGYGNLFCVDGSI